MLPGGHDDPPRLLIFLPMPRSRFANLLSLLALVSVVAVLSCISVFYLFIRPQLASFPAHETFVQQLRLTPEREQGVAQIDAGFEEERLRLMEDFEKATEHLARLLEDESEFSNEVSDAIDRIHHVHGALQALSVRRYFAILEELPPEKQPELRRLASRALSQPE